VVNILVLVMPDWVSHFHLLQRKRKHKRKHKKMENFYPFLSFLVCWVIKKEREKENVVVVVAAVAVAVAVVVVASNI